MINCDKNKHVVKDALKITKALNRHLDEKECTHSIIDLVLECFEFD